MGLGPEVSSGEFHATVRGMRAQLLDVAGKASARLSWSD
jgi:hypothetical protein